MSEPHKPLALIFDMDGLLLDTENLYMQASVELLAQYGKTFDWAIKEQIMGRPAQVSAKMVVEAFDLPLSPEEYLAKREVRLKALLEKAEPMPGARELCLSLKTQGILHAVATSSHRPLFEFKTRAHAKMFSGFDVVVTGDDPHLKNGKPAPDIFLLAAERLNVDPMHCIAFEDSPNGVEAAHAAGMTVVAIPDPRLNRALVQKAHHILPSLADFNLEQWRLTNSS